ncbi:hypothetical protein FMM05_12875 [Flavobacterium zepuense]|uniref:Uncharacterized protein n=1 Tax=Flavobacterium zepuense TaxID=2593302 RepID=A0A552UZA2_9FLAO|nr:hypothetical protein [Flavobacterium zepuense]TRW23549.1 hypothetical protein FMM05_12875 [Flavobacterium zepuense]
MSNQNSVDTLIPGGWTTYHKPTAEDLTVFNEAMHGFVGVKYTPQEVATQLVNGTNYRFKCSATMPPSNAIWEAIVLIHKPIHGKPVVYGIEKL